MTAKRNTSRRASSNPQAPYRPPRTERVRRGTVATERDWDALLLIGVCRYLTMTQVARELFSSEDRCSRRLRALYDLGYLNIALTSGGASANLYALTRRGLSLLQQHRPEAVAVRLPGTPPRLAGVAHHLLVADCRLFAAAWGMSRSAPLTRWANAGGTLATELNIVGLEPDGLAEFATRAGPIVVAAECDRSTEGVAVTMRRKMERYVAVAESGRVDALWLVVTGGAERQASLWRLVRDLGLGDWTRIIPHAVITARPVMELPPRCGDRP